MITDEEIFEKNLILSTQFDRYILEHPEFAEKIPVNAQIVLLPEDDAEFRKKTLKSIRHSENLGNL
jgi:hypothetical protein